MIANDVELRVALRGLRILEEALQALQTQLSQENPWLLEVASQAYGKRKEQLQGEVDAYVRIHPEAVTLLKSSYDDLASSTTSS